MKKKYVLSGLISLTIASLFFACSDDETKVSLTEVPVSVGDRSVASYTSGKSHEYLVVFESGHGDDASIWLQKNIVSEIVKSADVVIYDRAGYGRSTPHEGNRYIPRLSDDLSAIIDHHRNGRKVILVGHSIGGWIIRDYAIKNPDQVHALLFIDTAHEHYNDSTMSQSIEDRLYDEVKAAYGESHGATQEARQLMEDIDYAATLAQLPNVPVVVLTCMKVDAQRTLADRQNAYNAQHELGMGVTEFIQIKVEDAGHYIQLDKPELVIQYLKSWIQ